MSKFKDHPNFVQYVDHALEDKFVNILMKRVEGVSLGDLFEYMNKGMDWDQVYRVALKMLTQLSESLLEMNKQNVTHRDLHTDNIMVSFGSNIDHFIDFWKILDFSFLTEKTNF